MLVKSGLTGSIDLRRLSVNLDDCRQRAQVVSLEGSRLLVCFRAKCSRVVWWYRLCTTTVGLIFGQQHTARFRQWRERPPTAHTEHSGAERSERELILR